MIAVSFAEILVLNLALVPMATVTLPTIVCVVVLGAIVTAPTPVAVFIRDHSNDCPMAVVSVSPPEAPEPPIIPPCVVSPEGRVSVAAAVPVCTTIPVKSVAIGSPCVPDILIGLP